MPVLPALAAAASSFFRCLTATGRAALRWFAPGHQVTRAKFETGEKENCGNLMASMSHNLWRKKTTSFFLELLVYHFIQYRGRNKSPYASSSWFQPSHIASEPACETAILKRYCKTSEVQRRQVHSVGGMFGSWEFLGNSPSHQGFNTKPVIHDLDALEYLHDLGTPLWKMIWLKRIPMFGYGYVWKWAIPPIIAI